MENGPAAYKRVYRSRRNKVLGGVCGGLGEYFTIDAVVIRLLWLVSIFVAGAGVLLYIISWILIPLEKDNGASVDSSNTPPPPDSSQPDSSTQQRSSSGRAIIGGILVVLGLLLLGHQVGVFWAIPWGWIWPSALIVIGIALLLKPQILDGDRSAVSQFSSIDADATSFSGFSRSTPAAASEKRSGSSEVETDSDVLSDESAKETGSK